MLIVNEIYKAISGESRFIGWPCTLIRLTGCHIRCSWCDTAHSFSGGQKMALDTILEQVNRNGFRTVLVTGGEPLLQPGVVPLMQSLLDDGRTVLLETSGTKMKTGAVPLSRVPEGVHRVVDLKAPGSGIGSEQIDWDGLASLGQRDEIKVVCAHRSDYEWARELVLHGGYWSPGTRVGFSPVQGRLSAQDLAEWILADGLDVCFQIQLHKVVWPDVERGV